MEIMISYFWLIRSTLFIFFVYAVYKTVKTKNKRWGILACILFILGWFNPVKMEYTNNALHEQQTYHREQQAKEVPPKITDNSFSEQKRNVDGIAQKDIWKKEYE